MNFFTQELKKITDRSEYIKAPKYAGTACVFKLSNDVTGKLEFISRGIANHYSALKLSLLNKREGPIDIQTMDLGDIIGYRKIYGNVQSPYIWKDSNDIHWFGYRPDDSDLSAMSESVDDYLSCFAEQEMTESEDEELSISLT